ncbi:MAG: hypothetical protein [Irmovirus amras]|uniref:Uncharacterized protein n=1 Tax=Circoviridae sp. TaxID=1954248 RepID=A0A345MVN5_9VIRU|nr:MAG: hypothetical protein [Circoviridae sp.]
MISLFLCFLLIQSKSLQNQTNTTLLDLVTTHLQMMKKILIFLVIQILILLCILCPKLTKIIFQYFLQKHFGRRPSPISSPSNSSSKI